MKYQESQLSLAVVINRTLPQRVWTFVQAWSLPCKFFPRVKLSWLVLTAKLFQQPNFPDLQYAPFFKYPEMYVTTLVPRIESGIFYHVFDVKSRPDLITWGADKVGHQHRLKHKCSTQSGDKCGCIVWRESLRIRLRSTSTCQQPGHHVWSATVERTGNTIPGNYAQGTTRYGSNSTSIIWKTRVQNLWCVTGYDSKPNWYGSYHNRTHNYVGVCTCTVPLWQSSCDSGEAQG